MKIEYKEGFMKVVIAAASASHTNDKLFFVSTYIAVGCISQNTPLATNTATTTICMLLTEVYTSFPSPALLLYIYITWHGQCRTHCNDMLCNLLHVNDGNTAETSVIVQ